MHRAILAVSLAAGLQSVVAQSTSLYIPGFDPQPIVAQIAGVDSSGHTTWDLTPASVTADDDSGFVGTVTLVEGSDSAHLTFADDTLSMTLGYDCALSNGLAICSGNADGEPLTETETVSSFAVALASGTAAPASATSSSGSGSPSGSGSSSNTVSSQSARSSSGSSASPSQTGTAKNSASQGVISCISLLGAVSFVMFWLH